MFSLGYMILAMTNRTAPRRTLPDHQYRVIVGTAHALLNTLGLMADDYMVHRMNHDDASAEKTRRCAIDHWRSCCASVADVAYWSDLDDSDHAETIALLREHLHADECALGLGSAAPVREVA